MGFSWKSASRIVLCIPILGLLVQRNPKSFLRLFFVSVASSIFIHVSSSIALAQSSESSPERGDFGITKCTDLLMGQYVCNDTDIDPETQQAKGCTKENPYVPVTCTVAPGIVCDDLSENKTFQKKVPCKWTNGRSFETALLLSVFLGMFGVDRFYLGYPAIGLVKFATLGFMFLGQLIDILLIATHVLTPADGSAYIVDYYGAATERLFKDNETFLKPGEVVIL